MLPELPPGGWLSAFVLSCLIYGAWTRTDHYRRVMWWVERKTGTEVGLNRLPPEDREHELEYRGGGKD